MEKKTSDKEKIREIIVENKSGFNTIEVIVIIIVSILFGIIVGGIITSSKSEVKGSRVSKELQEFVTTYNNILDNYYDKVSEKELVNAAIKGMVSSLDDPYSLYMNNDETNSFNQEVDGQYVGIGASVGVKDGKKYIVGLFEDSPAKKADLRVGDIFLKVDNKDVSSISLGELTKLIKGKDGTKVNITVLRDNKEINKAVVRSNIDIPSVKGKVIEKNNQKIGYIRISNFASNTYNQFKDELNKLEKKKIKSLIIDVRSNPGGHLTQVSKILELFMNKKKVLYQIENKGKKTKRYSTTDENRKYKIAVLINSNSASASELLAAAFKESYNKSILVGTKSYGKGTVQKAFQLSSGSSLKYTTERWLTPKGNWIERKGVMPTEVVELSDEYKKNPSESTDNQLQKAIELLTK